MHNLNTHTIYLCACISTIKAFIVIISHMKTYESSAHDFMWALKTLNHQITTRPAHILVNRIKKDDNNVKIYFM